MIGYSEIHCSACATWKITSDVRQPGGVQRHHWLATPLAMMLFWNFDYIFKVMMKRMHIQNFGETICTSAQIDVTLTITNLQIGRSSSAVLEQKLL